MNHYEYEVMSDIRKHDEKKQDVNVWMVIQYYQENNQAELLLLLYVLPRVLEMRNRQEGNREEKKLNEYLHSFDFAC